MRDRRCSVYKLSHSLFTPPPEPEACMRSLHGHACIACISARIHTSTKSCKCMPNVFAHMKRRRAIHAPLAASPALLAPVKRMAGPTGPAQTRLLWRARATATRHRPRMPQLVPLLAHVLAAAHTAFSTPCMRAPAEQPGSRHRQAAGAHGAPWRTRGWQRRRGSRTTPPWPPSCKAALLAQWRRARAR